MSHDSSNDEQLDRIRDEPQQTSRAADNDPKQSGDPPREKMAWALFILLTIYVLLHPLPWMPDYSPDPTIVGAIVTGLVSLLVTRVVGGTQ